MSHFPFTQHSSGDLLADRRYAYAEAALAEGDGLAAHDLFSQTLELTPYWLPAWMGLGKACLALNNTEQAVSAFRQVASLDEDDRLGSRAYLAQLGAEGGSFTNGYVTALFDDYAPRFEEHLTGALDYRAPQALADALGLCAGKKTFRRILDLGCGTGLMARSLHGQAEEVFGVDLSERMLDIAGQTGLYTRLDQADCVSWLEQQAAASADLVIAADVFCYMEGLIPIFDQVHRVLEISGLFAFTVQVGADAGFRVGADLRVHHNPAYIRDIAHKSGFTLNHERLLTVRKDRGLPVPGAVFVLQR